jgi:hypothetical protein
MLFSRVIRPMFGSRVVPPNSCSVSSQVILPFDLSCRRDALNLVFGCHQAQRQSTSVKLTRSAQRLN